jgi:hypothetical protein
LIVVEREASISAIFITKTSSQTINHVDDPRGTLKPRLSQEKDNIQVRTGKDKIIGSTLAYSEDD